MLSDEYRARVNAVKFRAHGRWSEILLALGLDERMVTRRLNMPCPFCGGRDRFQFTDKFAEGNYICRQCGPGGGFQLAQGVLGLDFHNVLMKVEAHLGMHATASSRPQHATDSSHMARLVQRIWAEARPIEPGDEVDHYLVGRGLSLREYPSALRFHPSLGYYERDASGKSRKVGEYAAMVAAVHSGDGRMVSLHRTYLHEGRKLPAADAKKILAPGIAGAAVRLHPATRELGITEGIEKSIAVHLATGKPTWAALSAGNLERLWIPQSVSSISIYADNDADGDFAGQAFAYALARRLKREGTDKQPREVKVFIPKTPGVDWSDIWSHRMTSQRRIAT